MYKQIIEKEIKENRGANLFLTGNDSYLRFTEKTLEAISKFTSSKDIFMREVFFYSKENDNEPYPYDEYSKEGTGCVFWGTFLFIVIIEIIVWLYFKIEFNVHNLLVSLGILFVSMLIGLFVRSQKDCKITVDEEGIYFETGGIRYDASHFLPWKNIKYWETRLEEVILTLPDKFSTKNGPFETHSMSRDVISTKITQIVIKEKSQRKLIRIRRNSIGRDSEAKHSNSPFDYMIRLLRKSCSEKENDAKKI